MTRDRDNDQFADSGTDGISLAAALLPRCLDPLEPLSRYFAVKITTGLAESADAAETAGPAEETEPPINKEMS